LKKYFILGAMLFNFTHTTVHADSPTIQDSAKGELLSDTSVSTLTEYKEKIAKLSELTTKEKEDFFKELYTASSKNDFEKVLKKANSKNNQHVIEKQEKEKIAKEKEKQENDKKPLKVFEVTAIYESGNRNAGTVLGTLADGAGMNYGTYSLTQNYTMKPYLEFLNKNYPELRSQLTGEINSDEFNASWIALGKSEPEKFQATQAQYIFEANILPVLEKLKKETGVDFLDGTHSIGSIGMISGMIHNAGHAWYSIIREAAISTKNESAQFNDKAFVERIGGWVRDNYSGVYAQSIRNRYAKQTPQEKERIELFTYTKKTN
jgi:hypothetical protein